MTSQLGPTRDDRVLRVSDLQVQATTRLRKRNTSMHPANQALRGLLELVGLAAIGFWGWTLGEGVWRYMLAVGLPIVVSMIWGAFRVPNDPGPAPVAVPGSVRLLIEAIVFGLVTYGFASTEYSWAALALLAVVVTHYVLDWKRVQWLVLNRR